MPAMTPSLRKSCPPCHSTLHHLPTFLPTWVPMCSLTTLCQLIFVPILCAGMTRFRRLYSSSLPSALRLRSSMQQSGKTSSMSIWWQGLGLLDAVGVSSLYKWGRGESMTRLVSIICSRNSISQFHSTTASDQPASY